MNRTMAFPFQTKLFQINSKKYFTSNCKCFNTQFFWWFQGGNTCDETAGKGTEFSLVVSLEINIIYYYDFLICKKNKVLKSVGKEKKLFIHDLRQILSKYHQILILRVNPQQTFLTCQEMKKNYLFKYTKFSNRIWNRE